MKAKKTLALCLAAVLAVSMTACGGAAAGGTKPEEGKTEAEKPTAPATEKELSIWVEKIFSDDANTAMEERIKKFGEENSVKVSYEFIAAADFMTKLNAAIEAKNNVPDITTSAVTKVLNYYPQNPYLDVTDIVEEINKERPYFQAIYDGSKIDGKNYFVPLTSTSCMMFVRKDKLAEKGITEMPKTWDEVFSIAEKVSDPANGFYGLGIGCGPTDEDGENMFRMMMWNEGANVFDKEGKNTIDSKGTVDLLQKYKDLYEAEVIPPAATTWDSGGNNSSYLMSESAIVFNAATLYNALKGDEANKELFDNTIVLPPPAGTANAAKMGFMTGLAIMETCKDVETATDLLKYVTDKEWYNEYVSITAPVFSPLFQDLKEEATWKEGINGQVISYAEDAEGYYGYPVESMKGRAIAAKHYFTFPIAEMMNKAVTNTVSVEDAVKEAAKKVEEQQATIKD